MEIKDLAGINKPLTRLIEVISDGIGSVSQSYLIRKNADAKAYEIRAISEAIKGVAEQHNLPVIYKEGNIEVWQKPDDKTLRLDVAPTENRLSVRLDYQERKRQDHIENITSIAAVNLIREEDIPNEKPDEDWVARFFSSAQDISSEEMQLLWGRILAGEIKRPGSYSLKTLDVIRNITRSDSMIFEKIGKIALKNGNHNFIAVMDKDWLKDKYEIHDFHHFALAELGAMYPTNLSLQLFQEEQVKEEFIIHGEFVLVINRNGVTAPVSMPIWRFTPVGSELLGLIISDNSEAYLESIGQYYLYHKAQVALAKITERPPSGEIHYEIIRELTELSKSK